MTLSILEVPDSRLRQVAALVERVDGEVIRLMEDMLATMFAAPGIGLAAPQVGILKRVLVVNVSGQGESHQPLCIANPEILWASTECTLCKEGCLSLPNQYAEVNRPSRIRMRYLDHRNKACEIETGGLLATVLQHEMDHLDGVLFVDYLSKLKRDMILRRLQKARRLLQSTRTGLSFHTNFYG